MLLRAPQGPATLSKQKVTMDNRCGSRAGQGPDQAAHAQHAEGGPGSCQNRLSHKEMRLKRCSFKCSAKQRWGWRRPRTAEGTGPHCAPRKAARRPWHRLPGRHRETRSLRLLPLCPRVRGWFTNLAATDHLDLLPSRSLLRGRPLLMWQGHGAEVLCLRVTRCGPGRVLRAPKPRDTSGAHSWGEGPPPESAPLPSLVAHSECRAWMARVRGYRLLCGGAHPRAP